jgi:hypothetical protein
MGCIPPLLDGATPGNHPGRTETSETGPARRPPPHRGSSRAAGAAGSVGGAAAAIEAMVAGMRRSLPRYRDIAVRHWFGHLLIEPDGENGGDGADGGGADALRTVEDVLVRRGGRLLTRSRVIHRDTPAEF